MADDLESYPKLVIYWSSGKTTVHAYTRMLTFNCEPAWYQEHDRPVLIDVMVPHAPTA